MKRPEGCAPGTPQKPTSAFGLFPGAFPRSARHPDAVKLRAIRPDRIREATGVGGRHEIGEDVRPDIGRSQTDTLLQKLGGPDATLPINPHPSRHRLNPVDAQVGIGISRIGVREVFLQVIDLIAVGIGVRIGGLFLLFQFL